MAKLNGVKTVEETNGEITKAAYDGAEYLLTDAPAVKGDLILSSDSCVDIDYGAFYVCTGGNSRDVYLRDNVGFPRDRNQKDYATYRKIEEANAMTTFKKGDVVVTVKKAGYAKRGQGVHYAGAIGKVKSVNGGLLTVKFDKQQPNNRVPKQIRKNFVIEPSEIRLATADEAASIAKKKAEQPTFKVGDKVRMLSDSLYGKKYKGKTGVVFEGADEDGDISVTPDGGGARGLFKADSLELLTETAPVIPQADDEIEFEGEQYRKVDRKAQAGDIVVFRNPKNDERWITLGKPYEAVTGDAGELEFEDNDGDRLFLYLDERRSINNTDVSEKVAPKYVPQEGDIVVVTKQTSSRNGVGDIGKVAGVGTSDFRVEVPSKPNGPDVNGNWHLPDSIRKATPAEVEAYEKALAQSADEAKWAKIGRKVGELKKGDIVRIIDACGAKLNDGDLIEVISDSCESSAHVKGDWAVYSELIAPVESTLK